MSEASTSTGEPSAKRPRRRSSPNRPDSPTNPKTPEPNVSHDSDLTESLLRLNNLCILKIFKCMDKAALCCMANVCKRFRSLVNMEFRCRYIKENTFTIGHDLLHDVSTFRRVLCKYGKYVSNFDMFGLNHIKEIEADLFDKYCPKLKYFSVYDKIINCTTDKSLFRRLIELTVSSCKFTGNVDKLFENCLQLEKLNFSGDLIEFKNVFVKKFPKLTTFELYTTNLNRTVDNAHDELDTFLKLNPQLTKFCCSNWLNDVHILSIVANVPNLKELHLTLCYSINQTPDAVLKLAELKSLKRLKLKTFDRYNEMIAPLMNAFANANIHLTSVSLSMPKMDPMIIQSVANLKTIRTLRLDNVTEIKGIDLVPLAVELPFLKYLEFRGKYDGGPHNIEISTFFDALSSANTLIEQIGLHDIEIDSMAIQSLIKLKSIKQCVINNSNQFSEADLNLLASELPLLTYLEIYNLKMTSMPMTLTARGLINIVKNGKRLEHFRLGKVPNFQINQSEFDALLNAVKSGEPNRKVELNIFGSQSSGNFIQKQLKLIW